MKRLFTIAVLCTLTTAVALADDWMAQLDDNTYFSQVSIPGTHDSATGEGWTGLLGMMAGASMGQTQDLTIAQQLTCGVRAFDLRPCVNDNQLAINHGVLQTKAMFPETLRQLCDFVTAHPTEFVVVVMRHESDGDDNNSQWGELMTACLTDEAVRPLLVSYKRDITVGELRGKVLLLSRDKYADTPFGGFITGWAHKASYVNASIKGPSGTAGTLYVQDYYEVMDNMTAKLNGIEKLLNFSTSSHSGSQYFSLITCINCASGYTASASSDGNRDNAAQCNKKIIDYLSDADHAGPTGIIFMDFAGVDTSSSYDVQGLTLVNTLIANNQRYVPAKKASATPITTIRQSATTDSDKLYNLSGQRVGNDYRGIVIRSGKKR